MRSSRFVSVLFVFVLAVVTATAQQLSPPTAQAPQSDPQALLVLSKMFFATGWSAANLPTDVLATGTVTPNENESQNIVKVTLKFKGFSEARTELQDTASPATTIINGEQASISNSSGAHSIPVHSALSTPPVTMLFLSRLLNTSDPNLTIALMGTETISGQAAIRIQMDRTPLPNDSFAEVRRRADHLTIWISTATFLPIQVQYPRISSGNPTATFLATQVYSDYRTISGVAVSFHQDEYGGNQRISSLQLTTVSFNTGLSDAEFAIAVPAQ
jgi:hypothetical protein